MNVEYTIVLKFKTKKFIIYQFELFIHVCKILRDKWLQPALSWTSYHFSLA